MSGLTPTTSSVAARQAQRSARHPANVVALVFGVVFCAMSAGAVLFYLGVLGIPDLQWAIPAVFFGAGFLGVLASVLRSRGSRTRR